MNALDMQALYELLSQGVIPVLGEAAADVNGDGTVNILDYQALYNLVRSAPHGGGTSVVVEPARTGAPAAEA